jgi:ATP-binding protein involved in chromosome partitioning
MTRRALYDGGMSDALRPPPRGQPGGQATIPFASAESATQVIAVASGKGGVGKSSLTANLAVALAQDGYRVGVVDADIWGYSIPRMLGASGQVEVADNKIVPIEAHGVHVISIGFFLDAERPVIWRGPMLHKALQQFLADVQWGTLDFLLCDLPPGTGDITISLAQMLPNADMVVVTTPQPVAQRVALRAGQMTAHAGMRVRGVIENMSTFVAPDTGLSYAIFGSGGGELLAAELGTELLGKVPIDARLREGADEGRPVVLAYPDSLTSKALVEIAQKLAKTRGSMLRKSLPLMG